MAEPGPPAAERIEQALQHLDQAVAEYDTARIARELAQEALDLAGHGDCPTSFLIAPERMQPRLYTFYVWLQPAFFKTSPVIHH